MNNNESVSSRLYLTSTEAAQLLGITAGTLHKWRASGDGPCYVKITNKLIGYRESDLVDFIAANVVDPSGLEKTEKQIGVRINQLLTE